MHTPQPDFFEEPTGAELRDAGMQQALDHAEEESPGWAEEAFDYLKRFIEEYVPRVGLTEFMGEDIRAWSHEQGLDRPPTARAWGGVINRARSKNLIERIGTRTVKNPTAHCANAAVWKVKTQ